MVARIYSDCSVKINAEINDNEDVYFHDYRIRNGLKDNEPKFRKLSGTSDKVKNVSGKSFFAGVLFPHYGHFLLESLSRFSNYNSGDFDQIVWCTRQSCFNNWQIEILKTLELDSEKHVFINTFTLLEELHVFDRGYIIWDYFSIGHSRYLERSLPENKEFKNKKVWITRHSKEIYNECFIEYVLHNLGWVIFDPVKSSVKDQISVFNDSDCIAGIEGSAFHTMIFSSNCIDNIIIFQRRMNDLNGNYRLISKVKNKNHKFINALGSKKSRNLGRYFDEVKVLKSLGVDCDPALIDFLEKRDSMKYSLSRNEIINEIRELSSLAYKSDYKRLAFSLIELAHKERPNGKNIQEEFLSLKKEIDM